MPRLKFYHCWILLFTVAGCNKSDGQHIVINFENRLTLKKEVDMIQNIQSLLSSQQIQIYLQDQLWIETFLIKSSFFKPTEVFIQSKKPKYVWRKKFYMDHKLSKFLYDGQHSHLIHLDMPIESLYSWIEAEDEVTLALDQFDLVIEEVNFNPAGGWHLITKNLRINLGDDLSTQTYQKLSLTLKYMFENNLTPSIIDLRYKAGAALNYGK
ncbi:MAG: hypothetical protein NWQ36_03230 [SAR86 cluster bacterium]|nr:hypothetical protein [SAR86 cluster bacterium]